MRDPFAYRRGLSWFVFAACLTTLLACREPEEPVAEATPTPPAPSAAAPTPSAVESLAHAHEGDDASPSPAVGREGGEQDTDAAPVTYGQVDGKPLEGYLAIPEGAGKVPGVILVHEWWGLNDNLRDMARQLASHGYLALAVDLYGGRTASAPGGATKLVQEVAAAPAKAESNFRQAAELLRQRGATRVGVVGWCFGGDWALRAGIVLGDDVDAVVMYYGEPTTERDRLAKLQAPLLGLFGGDDRSIPLKSVRTMESTLRDLGKPVTIRVFPGARHAFANPSGKRYEPKAAEEAWGLTLDFLGTHLRSV